MAIKFGKLTVEMSANVAGLSRDLAEAKNVSVRNFGLIKDAAESVNTRLSLIFGSQIVGHLIGVGRAGVAAFQSIKHSAIDTADELNKLSQKTGFSVESLSGLKYAAQLADVSLVGLTKGLKSLSINMVDARGGNRDLVETFRRLGISLEDPETALMQLAERFQQMPDGAQKARDAVKLFGKEGLTMIPFLNQGRDGIAELTAEAQRFGLVIDGETARQAEAFNDNLTRLQANVSGLTQQLGMSMMPTLLAVSENLLEAKTATGGLDENVRSLVSTRPAVEGYLESMATGLAHVAEQAVLTKRVFSQMGTSFEAVGVDVQTWIKRDALKSLKAMGADPAAIDAAINDLDHARAHYMDSVNRQMVGIGQSPGYVDAVKRTFDDIRRTVRMGNQKYLMDSAQDAQLLQAAINKNYKAAAKPENNYDGTPSANARAAKKAAEAAAQRLAVIKNADLDLEIAKAETEAEAIFARSATLVKIQQNAIDAYADSLNDAAFAAAELQAQYNTLVDAHTQAMTEAAQAGAASLASEIDALRQRNEEIGLTGAQMSTLTQSRMDDAIAAAEQRYASTELTAESADYIAALGEQIKLLKEKKTFLGQGDIKQALADEAKAAQEAWKTASADIERSLTDALMRGFEGGKGWAENFRDTLKNLFNTLVLRPIIQPIAQYGAQALMGMVGMGGAGAASANPLSLLSTASSLSGTAGVLSTTASGLMSGATSIGSILGASGTNIAAAASYGTAIGSTQTAMLVAQEAGMAASAGASGAISGALSAIPVWGWAAMAGAALFGDKIFGGKTTQTGAGINLSVVGGNAINGYGYADYERDGGWFRSDKNWRTTTAMDTSAMSAGLGQVAALLGQIGGPDAIARLRTYTASYEGAQEGAEAWIATVLDGMATLTLGGYWARFSREGEAATDALQRLITTLGTVSALRASLSDTLAVVAGQITEAEAAARAAGREMQGLYALLGQTQDVQTRIELEGQLQSAATTRYQAELQYLNTLRDTVTQLSASITSTRAAVDSSLQEISPLAVPTAAQLREAIAGVSGPSLPSLSGVMAASDRAAWAQQAATLGETITAASARIFAAQSAIEPLRAQYDAALRPYFSYLETYSSSAGFGFYGKNSTLPTAGYADWYNLSSKIAPITAAAEPYQKEWSAAKQALAPAQSAMAAGNALYGQALSIADAQSALAAAQEAYSAALTGYAGDAQDAISALENLRGETMRYYQAQSALADLMGDSATRLRDAASAARLTLGGNASAAASIARQYDQAYTMALSTGGETLAGYADTLTTLLPDLLTTLAGESSSRIEYQRRAALAISQSEAIAARLDTQAPQGYESESLSLLGAIDTGLLALSEGLESIDQQILAAIQGSRDATVDVLTQIRDLLGYELPGHADGLARVPYDDYAARLHAGEAVIDASTMTGLRRYGIPVHSTAPAGGSVDTTALIAEVRALRADNADLRAEVRAVVTHTARTARLLDRVMPDGDALAVRVEVAA